METPLGPEIRKLRDELETERSRLINLNRVGRVLTALLVVVLVAFLASLYGKVTAMYAPENFEGPIREEARHLLPRIEPELRLLWDETAPVYGELASRKFEEALPVLQRNSRDEFDALLANLQTNAERQAFDALDRIARKHERRLQELFPRLSDAQQADELGQQWMETIEADFEQILLHFHDRFSGDLGELQATLEAFVPSRYEHMDQEALTRQFAHLWLMKVDRMVVTGEKSPSYRDLEEDRHDD